jgi:hypothetical protein
MKKKAGLVKKASPRTLAKRVRQSVRLQPDPVPRPLWRITAYRMLKRGKPWKSIRQDALERAGHKCDVCGAATQPLFCHERWHYDEKRGTATLYGFQILCDPCNWATHIGLAGLRGHGEEALAQLCRVSGISRKQAEVLRRRALETWERRSQVEWKVAVKRKLIQRYPQLKPLVRRESRDVSLAPDGAVTTHERGAIPCARRAC